MEINTPPANVVIILGELSEFGVIYRGCVYMLTKCKRVRVRVSVGVGVLVRLAGCAGVVSGYARLKFADRRVRTLRSPGCIMSALISSRVSHDPYSR